MSIPVACKLYLDYLGVHLSDQCYYYTEPQLQTLSQPLICFNTHLFSKYRNLGSLVQHGCFTFIKSSFLKCILSAYIFLFWNPFPIPHSTTQYHTKNNTGHFKQLFANLE